MQAWSNIDRLRDKERTQERERVKLEKLAKRKEIEKKYMEK